MLEFPLMYWECRATVVKVCCVFQGDRDKFETYYRQQRWKQARLSLQPPQNMVREPLTDQHSYEC